MLEFEGLNYWAIAVAWLVNVVVGAYWYSPAGFGKKWAKLSGVNHMKMPENEANKAIVFVSISAVFQAVVLAVVLQSLSVTDWMHGLKVAIVLWLGLVAATTVGTTFYHRHSWSFWWLNGSYFLLVMLINAAILTLWQ
jgi:hypothetical protein